MQAQLQKLVRFVRAASRENIPIYAANAAFFLLLSLFPALLLLMWSADSSGAAGMLLTVCTIIITAREFTVTGFRVIAATNRVVIAADKLGKIKTVVQDIAIVFLMIGNWPFCLVNIPVDYILLIAATVLTIISGINYIVKNRGVFRESK